MQGESSHSARSCVSYKHIGDNILLDTEHFEGCCLSFWQIGVLMYTNAVNPVP